MPLRVIKGSDQRPLARFARPTAIVGLACMFVLLILAKSASASGVATIAITSPTNGSTLTGSTLTIAGTSTNATRVQVCIVGTDCRDATGLAFWTVTFDISTLSEGSYTIRACAIESTGDQTCESVNLQVTVSVIRTLQSVEAPLETYAAPALAVGSVAAALAAMFVPRLYRVGQGVAQGLAAVLVVVLAIRTVSTNAPLFYGLAVALLIAALAANRLGRPKPKGGAS